MKESNERDIDTERKIRIDLQRKGGLPPCRGSGSCGFLIQRPLRKSLWQNRSLITLTGRPAICSRLEARQASGCIKTQPLCDAGMPNGTLVNRQLTRGHLRIEPLKQRKKSIQSTFYQSLSTWLLFSASSKCYFSSVFGLSTHSESLNVKSASVVF